MHLTLQQCVAAHYSLPELKEAGYSAREMKGVFPLHEFREAGFNYVEMKEAQLADTALAAAGFILIFQEMPGLDEDESPRAPNKMSKSAGARDAGQVAELKEEGCSLEELKGLGFGPAALKAHYSVNQLKGAGFSVAELKAVCTLRELRMAGFSVAELKKEFSVAELKSAGFSAAQLKEEGFSAQELRQAGFSASEVEDAGFTPQDLRSAGYSAEDLKACHFSVEDAKKAGFSDLELKGANFSLTNWRKASPRRSPDSPGLGEVCVARQYGADARYSRKKLVSLAGAPGHGTCAPSEQASLCARYTQKEARRLTAELACTDKGGGTAVAPGGDATKS